MTETQLTESMLVKMLAERLQEHQDSSDCPVQVWVIAFTEELTAPSIHGFFSREPLIAHLRQFVGKPGFVFVIKGQRCRISVGSLPTLFMPGEVIPLFTVEPTLFTDDGSMVAPPPPQVVPTTPALLPDDDDETVAGEAATDEATAPAVVVVPGPVLAVSPDDTASSDEGPQLFDGP
jgi:hypothetical protein